VPGSAGDRVLRFKLMESSYVILKQETSCVNNSRVRAFAIGSTAPDGFGELAKRCTFPKEQDIKCSRRN